MNDVTLIISEDMEASLGNTALPPEQHPRKTLFPVLHGALAQETCINVNGS